MRNWDYENHLSGTLFFLFLEPLGLPGFLFKRIFSFHLHSFQRLPVEASLWPSRLPFGNIILTAIHGRFLSSFLLHFKGIVESSFGCEVNRLRTLYAEKAVYCCRLWLSSAHRLSALRYTPCTSGS